MTDKEKVLRHNFRGSYDDLIPAENGELVRAFDYDRLAAKLAEAERVARYETDIAQQALDQIKAEKARAEAAEAALPAVYRLALVEKARAVVDRCRDTGIPFVRPVAWP